MMERLPVASEDDIEFFFYGAISSVLDPQTGERRWNVSRSIQYTDVPFGEIASEIDALLSQVRQRRKDVPAEAVEEDVKPAESTLESVATASVPPKPYPLPTQFDGPTQIPPNSTPEKVTIHDNLTQNAPEKVKSTPHDPDIVTIIDESTHNTPEKITIPNKSTQNAPEKVNPTAPAPEKVIIPNNLTQNAPEKVNSTPSAPLKIKLVDISTLTVPEKNTISNYSSEKVNSIPPTPENVHTADVAAPSGSEPLPPSEASKPQCSDLPAKASPASKKKRKRQRHRAPQAPQAPRAHGEGLLPTPFPPCYPDIQPPILILDPYYGPLPPPFFHNFQPDIAKRRRF